MHRNRTWPLTDPATRDARNRLQPIAGGNTASQRIDFTQLNSNSLANIGTFSRNGSARYVDSTGFNLVVATADVPRFEYDSNGNLLGLLLEGTGINYCRWSEDQSNTVWNEFNGAAKNGKSTVVTMPDNSKNGNKFTPVNGVATGVYQTFATMGISITPSLVVTCSVWACVESGTGKARISYYNATTQASTYGSDFDLTTTPRRISATFTLANTNTSSNITIENGSDKTATPIVWWGYQVEVATNYTSYIPSNASTGTRNADSFAITTGLTGTNGWFNTSQGTILVTGSRTDMTSGGYPRLVVFSPTTTTNKPLISIGVSQSDGKYFGNYNTGTEGNTDIGDDLYSVRTSNQKTLFACAYSYSQGEYAFSLNGESATSSVPTGTVTTSGINRVTFTRDLGTLSWYLKGFVYWPTKKSKAEISQITYDSITGPLPPAGSATPMGSVNHIDDNNAYVVWSTIDGSGTTTASSGASFVLPYTCNYDLVFDVAPGTTLVYPYYTINNGSVIAYSGSTFAGTKNQVIRIGMQTGNSDDTTPGNLYLVAYNFGEIRRIVAIPFTAYPA